MAQKQEVVKILLKTYDHHLINQITQNIIDSISDTGVQIRGPIPLPTKKEIFTVLRSPFVNKDSREQFGRLTHKRLIQIINPNAKAINVLMNMNIPYSVNICIKK
ncbi:30S ribosomal protein S10 [Candidatus Phytoplasma melaleucae]|uniref:Small ribosomal subunit protein uS10 n=1 Tax=Candidatus Phytoplasma melaleucae TaxID=2982630 RepID=A0ABT9DE61_9MOLU|nr:30S ribosomal protein S10 ['Melaleuca sp.' phytoplasma]MDO8168128.1 30S ribosomal protein S10 ['Melaleuca sp.' phytoplasma]MDV3205244.1 30S ribosomal protein S10 [Weeping tea tree witches'-broom phytoplasma]